MKFSKKAVVTEIEFFASEASKEFPFAVKALREHSGFPGTSAKGEGYRLVPTVLGRYKTREAAQKAADEENIYL